MTESPPQAEQKATTAKPPYVAPAISWEQEFVGLQALSDPCKTQFPPPGYCQGNTF